MERSDGEEAKPIEEEGEGEAMDTSDDASRSAKVLHLLRQFLAVQRRRAEAYSKLSRGFSEYMSNGGEVAYQQLCGEITQEFNDCSKQVLDLESTFLLPDICQADLANLLRALQAQEKQKLHLTIKIQLLKKSGRPSERPVTHDSCHIDNAKGHQCLHVHEITEAEGTQDAEADAEYDSAFKEAIRGVQEAVTCINEYMEEVRYEIEALDS